MEQNVHKTKRSILIFPNNNEQYNTHHMFSNVKTETPEYGREKLNCS